MIYLVICIRYSKCKYFSLHTNQSLQVLNFLKKKSIDTTFCNGGSMFLYCILQFHYACMMHVSI